MECTLYPSVAVLVLVEVSKRVDADGVSARAARAGTGACRPPLR
eukprot:COSAG02_NODE_1538_length_12042_cov_323.842083_11_plen_44_part_00